MDGQALAAPAHAPFEAANVLRRLEAMGELDRSAASLAHDDLQALPIDVFPFEAVASRAWALRHNATIYDAAYLALAEILDVALVTLDTQLSTTDSPRYRSPRRPSSRRPRRPVPDPPRSSVDQSRLTRAAKIRGVDVVGHPGLEPGTSGLKVRCSAS